MFKYILIFLLFPLALKSSNFCEVKDIKVVTNELNLCKEGQLLFGYLSFNSNKRNLNYIYEKSLNVKIVLDYYDVIMNFIMNYCDMKKNTLKIKEITNLNKLDQNKFENEVIISCKFKP